MQLGTTMDQVICKGCHRPLEAGQRIVWHDDALHHEACAAASLVTINLAIMEYTYYRGELSMAWNKYAECHDDVP